MPSVASLALLAANRGGSGPAAAEPGPSQVGLFPNNTMAGATAQCLARSPCVTKVNDVRHDHQPFPFLPGPKEMSISFFFESLYVYELHCSPAGTETTKLSARSLEPRLSINI